MWSGYYDVTLPCSQDSATHMKIGRPGPLLLIWVNINVGMDE